MENIQLYGRIDAKGDYFISGMDRFKAIFKRNPNKSFILEVNVYERNSKPLYAWYIIKSIVPAFIEGHKNHGRLITPEEALADIIETCPIFYKTQKKRYKVFDFTKFAPDCDMDEIALSIAIEWLHLYCVEHFGIIVGNYKSI